MKKIVEFFAKVFFAVFIMGVFVSLCGVGEFCGPLMLIGLGMVCAGIVLSVVCFTIGERIERTNK